jgi:hypothetical protein
MVPKAGFEPAIQIIIPVILNNYLVISDPDPALTLTAG